MPLDWLAGLLRSYTDYSLAPSIHLTGGYTRSAAESGCSCMGEHGSAFPPRAPTRGRPLFRTKISKSLPKPFPTCAFTLRTSISIVFINSLNAVEMGESNSHQTPAKSAPEAKGQPGLSLSRWESGTAPSIPTVDDQDNHVRTTARNYQQTLGDSFTYVCYIERHGLCY